jgi:hypothetical protein
MPCIKNIRLKMKSHQVTILEMIEEVEKESESQEVKEKNIIKNEQ